MQAAQWKDAGVVIDRPQMAVTTDAGCSWLAGGGGGDVAGPGSKKISKTLVWRILCAFADLTPV